MTSNLCSAHAVAVGGCWCMWWRVTRAEYERNKGDANKKALRRIVRSGSVPGLMAYLDRAPVGWCSVAPREEFGALERSRTLKRVDEAPVWSLVCFFIPADHRGRGIGRALLDHAVNYAVSRGAAIVEGYPVEPRKDTMPSVFAFTGLVSMFRAAGFEEVARRSKTRPIMRYVAQKR